MFLSYLIAFCVDASYNVCSGAARYIATNRCTPETRLRRVRWYERKRLQWQPCKPAHVRKNDDEAQATLLLVDFV